MRKVLLITRPIAPPWDEASKNFAYYLAKTLDSFEFGLLTNGLLLNLPKNIIQKSIYTSNSLSFLQKIKLLRFIATEKSFDIFHFLFTPTKLNSLLFKMFLKNKNIKTVQTIATLREDLYSDKDFQKILFADQIITYSDYAKNKLVSLGFQNVTKIYPGIDLEIFSKKEKKKELLEKYGLSDSDFVINFTGEYVRLGAIDDVIESFSIISSKIPDAKLSLAVRIKNEKDAEKKKEIIKTLEKNNLLEKVIFHDDGKYEMQDIFNLCDISLFPVQNMQGKFDVPLAVIEAMACEKPVIISDLPVLQEFAKDENSVRIEKGNVNELNSKILDLYDNPEKRNAIGKNARKYVEENFNIKNVAEQYENVYEKI